MTQTTFPATAATATATATETQTSRRVQIRRFTFHYVEMILAMFAGMALFGGLIRLVLGIAGISYVTEAHPYIAATEMGLTMAAGMALWMRIRGHHWRHVTDMSAAMVLPLVVLFPLAWTGVISAASLPMLEHVVMLPLMLAVMLRTPHAYTK